MRHYKVSSPRDFAPFAAAFGRRAEGGEIAILLLDRRWRAFEPLVLHEADDRPEEITRFLSTPAVPKARADKIVLATVRDQLPADRPSDEQQWERWHAVAAEHGRELVDWWIVCLPRLLCFSVAEHSSVGAAWGVIPPKMAYRPPNRRAS